MSILLSKFINDLTQSKMTQNTNQINQPRPSDIIPKANPSGCIQMKHIAG